jgi:hypothetical protein
MISDPAGWMDLSELSEVKEVKSLQSKHRVKSWIISWCLTVLSLVLVVPATYAEILGIGSNQPARGSEDIGQVPSVTNPPSVESLVCDGDTEGMLYARYKDYRLRCYCVDGDGADDIDEVKISISGPGGECVLTYSASTGRFYAQDNKSELFELNRYGCKAREGKSTLRVDFVGKIGWAFGDADFLDVTVDVTDLGGMYSTSEFDLLVGVESDIEIDAEDWSLHDATLNPATPAAASARVEYQGTEILVPEEEIMSISVVSETDEILGTASLISSGDLEYTTSDDVGVHEYRPVVQLLNGDTYDFDNLTATVTLDIIEISAIDVSGEIYDDGIKWQNNDGISDDMIVSITADWMYSGNRFLGDLVLGYDGDPDGFKVAYSGQASVVEDAGYHDVIVRENVRVTSAVENDDNVYGPGVTLGEGVTPVTLGWDSEPPEITQAGWEEDSDYLHASESMLFIGRAMPGNVTARVAGAATDNNGSGINRAEFSNEDVSSPCPEPDLSADQWSGEYTVNSKTVLLSTPATVTVYDNVGNSSSVELPYTRDDEPPAGYFSNAPKVANKSYEVIVHGAEDYAGSGVKCIYLDVFDSNRGDPTTARSKMKGETSRGVMYYRYYAVDNVGNKGTIFSDKTVNNKFRLPGVLGADGDANKRKSIPQRPSRVVAEIHQTSWGKHIDSRIATGETEPGENETLDFAADDLHERDLFPDGRSEEILDDVLAHPNPLRTGAGDEIISFAGVLPSASVSIYDVRGALVARVYDDDSDGVAAWELGGHGSHEVASGIYFYVTTVSRADGSSELARGKITILR